MQRLHEPRIIRVVAERGTQPFDGGVQAVLEIDERPCRPQTLAKLFTRHDFARMLQHQRENFERLILQPYPDPTLTEFARAQIDLEGAKSLDVGRRSFERQHRREKFISVRPRSRHFTKM